MDSNIVLIGLLGVGKSVVATELSRRLKRTLLSTDELIEKREGMPIEQIFKQKGEEHFRRVKKEVVNEAAQKERVIIDCGGGVVLQQENIDRLKKNGILFFLAANPRVIYERIKDQIHLRPLLQVKNPQMKITQLLEERKHYYSQTDHTIETSRHTVEQTVEAILKIIQP